MIKTALTSLLLICAMVGSALQPAMSGAQTAEQIFDSAGLSLAIDPPQASAEALLKLPTIYAMPGTISYWLKGVWEDLQFMLANTPEKRADLLLKFSQKRLAEGLQAIQDDKPQLAVDALTSYQNDQAELANYLAVLQGQDSFDITAYLSRLKEQLQIQQSLQQYVEEQVKDQELNARISSLLYLQPSQTTAFSREYERVVLGQKNRQNPQQATPSAEATTSAELDSGF